VYVEVARDHRRSGIGSTLLMMLRREAEESPSGVTRLRCKVEPGTSGAAFAEAAGLTPIQHTRLVVVEPAALKLPVFGDGSEEAASERIEDLATGSVELSDVVGRYYSSVHGWDSPGELAIGTVQRLFLDELSGAHGAIVLRAPKASAFGSGVPASRKGRIQAFAISYAQGNSDHPPMCSSATSRSWTPTRPRPRSVTSWPSSRTNTRCSWKSTIRWQRCAPSSCP
jgi:hypothetical protein